MYHLVLLLSRCPLQVKLSHKKASECTILFYCFQNVLHKSQYRIKTVRMPHLVLLLSKLSLQVKISYQNRHNVPFSFIAFKMSPASQTIA